MYATQKTARFLSAAFAVSCVCVLFAAVPARAQNQAVASLNLPEVLTAGVSPGSTGVSVAFELGAASSLALNLIVPVDNATFVLLDPSQNTVLTSSSPGVEFAAGSGNPATATLPGGIFNTTAIPDPADGTWTLNFSFPAAPEQTAIVATIIADSPIKVGLVIAGNRFVLGRDVAVGVLALEEGLPLGGLAPEITITPVEPPGSVETYTGLDDGAGLDGLASDGIYTAGITFQSAGTYTIAGSVEIPAGASTITRNISPVTVNVDDAPASLAGSTFNYVNPTIGTIFPADFESFCLGWISFNFQFRVWAAGDAVVRLTVRASNGKEVSFNNSMTNLQPGGFYSTQFKLTGKDILEPLEVDGVYSFDKVEVFLVDDNGIVPALLMNDLGETVPIPADTWCREEGVEIGNPDDSSTGEALTVEQIVEDGYIGALRITFPVFVAFDGIYTFSFKVIGADDREVFVASSNPSLTQGPNDVTIEIDAEKFLDADGPYSVVAVLVSGPGGAASLSELGAPFEASRWQFLPALSGDLDNDLDVDVMDRDLLLEFRRQSALNPGDRRDLNRDGAINILDARVVAGLACGADDCFPSAEGEGEGAPAKIQSAPPQRTDRQEQGF